MIESTCIAKGYFSLTPNIITFSHIATPGLTGERSFHIVANAHGQGRMIQICNKFDGSAIIFLI